MQEPINGAFEKNIFSLSIDDQGEKHFSSIVSLMYTSIVLSMLLQLVGLVVAGYSAYTMAELERNGSGIYSRYLLQNRITLGYTFMLTVLLSVQTYHNASFANQLRMAKLNQDQGALNRSFDSLRKALVLAVIGLSLQLLHFAYYLLSSYAQ